MSKIASGLLGLSLLVGTLGFADSVTTGPFLYSFQLDSGAELRFTGNNPPIDQALIDSLKKQAQAEAEKTCKAMLGSYTLLEATGEGDFSESILVYNLRVPYICGREILSTSEVVPYLVQYVATSDGDGDSADQARTLLADIGDNSVAELLAALRTPEYSEDQKIQLIQTVGQLLAKGTTLDFEVLDSLKEIVSYGTEMMSYEAGLAFGKAFRAGYYLDRNLASIDDLTLAKVSTGIAQSFKAQSSYSVSIIVLEHLLKSTDSLVLDYTLDAIRERGLTKDEFNVLLVQLTPLADPTNPALQSTVFQILSQETSDRIAGIIAKAIDPSLLKSAEGKTYLEQAMLALKNYVGFDITKSALPALKEIENTAVAPEDQYLQQTAKTDIELLGGQ